MANYSQLAPFSANEKSPESANHRVGTGQGKRKETSKPIRILDYTNHILIRSDEKGERLEFHNSKMKSFILTALVLITCSSQLVTAQKYVQACMNGAYDGVNLIQVNCTETEDRAGEVLINNSSGITMIQNCQFNNCGNIKAKTPVQFRNVVFNNSTYGGSTTFNQGGAGGAVALDGTNGYFENVTFTNCKAE